MSNYVYKNIIMANDKISSLRKKIEDLKFRLKVKPQPCDPCNEQEPERCLLGYDEEIERLKDIICRVKVALNEAPYWEAAFNNAEEILKEVDKKCKLKNLED